MQGSRSFHAFPSFYSAASLMVLRAVTPVHAGVGRTAGAVDLPVQRDERGYPGVYGSSIKGALKTALLYSFAKKLGSNYGKARRAVTALLGPEPGEPETFESSVALLDAYSLAVPARSLRGVYAYVTSPALLSRLCDGLELLASLSRPTYNSLRCRKLVKELEEALERGKAVCVNGGAGCDGLKVKDLGGRIVLVEEVFLEETGPPKGVKGWLSELAKVLGLDRPLLALDDDTARVVIERSLVRYARVRLKRYTKTVEEGPWTEEYLPPKTILHALLLFKRPPLTSGFVMQVVERGKQKEASDEDYLEALERLGLLEKERVEEVKRESDPLRKSERVAEAIKEVLKEHVGELGGYLVLGGLETVGRGVVKLEFIEGEALKSVLLGASEEGG